MVSSENFVDILSEIIDQATTLGLESPDLDGIQQAQLLDILFTAGNLLKNLRRSIRRYLSVPLKLSYEVTGRIIGPRKATRSRSASMALPSNAAFPFPRAKS